MPNTKSAERRARVSAKRQARNKSVKTRLRSLEKSYRTLVAGGKTEEASKLLPTTFSAIDKAAKKGVIPKARASRKKSRLSLRLKAPAPAAAK